MASLPGYEYDIFISYRQNDNRSGWVTAFVQQLQQELAATLKESVSIYFDENPHDGILETHVVSKTLEGKLKCLIFIPVLSQTYCDSKSFAWQSEFCAFNKLSKEDPAGRDVRLGNGNIASRILPVKIHDLDPADLQMLEVELGGPLRAIDFIYKAPGVNRPLLINEDNPNQNVNKTFYRDQINKVANGIKNIIQALNDPDIKPRATPHIEKSVKRASSRSAIIVSVVAVLLTIGVISIFMGLWDSGDSDNEGQTKSVAVLAFSDLSPGHDNEWFSDGLTDEILNRLTNLRKLRVTARTSSFYFKGKNAPIQEIGEKLGVDHVVEGSVQRVGNKLRITAQLIRAADGFHIWSESYDRSAEDLFDVQSDIALSIAQSLLSNLSEDSKAELVVERPANDEAHDAFLLGIHFHEKYLNSLLDTDFRNAEARLQKAIMNDPQYSEAYGELANLYDTWGARNNEEKWKQRDSLIEIGSQLNPESISILCVKAWRYLKTPENFDSAYFYIKKLHEINPNDIRVSKVTLDFYFDLGLDDISEKICRSAIALDPLTVTFYNRLAFLQLYTGRLDEGWQSIQTSLNLDPQNATIRSALFDYFTFKGNTEKMIEVLEGNLSLDFPREVSELQKTLLIAIRDNQMDKAFERVEAMSNVNSRWPRFTIHYVSKSPPDLLAAPFDSLTINNDFPVIELENNPSFVALRNEPIFKKKLEIRKKIEAEYRRKYTNLN